MKNAVASWMLVLAVLAVTADVGAQQDAAQITGTLKKVRDSDAVRLGYRQASFPFSYLDGRGQPVGYSIDLCRKLVDALGEELGFSEQKPLRVDWVPVTAADRIDMIVHGGVDLECGSTTANVTRQKQVAFSPIIFVAGTRLLVKRGSGIRSYRDLDGKSAAVTTGTTNEQYMVKLVTDFKLRTTLTSVKDHDEGFAALQSGRVAAFITDDVLLYGLISRARDGRQYLVVGETLTYDPYAIVFRRGDPQLRALVDKTFRQMAENGELTQNYHHWFLRKLPSGEQLNMPMSPQLKAIFEALTATPSE